MASAVQTPQVRKPKVHFSGVPTPTHHKEFPRRSSSGISRRNSKSKPPWTSLDEVAEYDWPELPPVSELKGAVARERLSKGISYLLPVNKSKNSVENVYSTNLRLVFKEPYLNDHGKYNENLLRASAKEDFRTTITPRRFGSHTETPDPKQLNAESAKVYKNFERSFPSTGTVGRRTLKNTEQRSGLYVPLEAKVPEDIQILREEAVKIVKSVQGLDEVFSSGPQLLAEEQPRETPAFHNLVPAKAKTSQLKDDVGLGQSKSAMPKKKLGNFARFEELNSIHVPSDREVPQEAKSPHLDSAKNHDIWMWLHNGEPQTDLNFFLEVCS